MPVGTNGVKRLWWVVGILIMVLATILTCLAASIDRRVPKEVFLRDMARMEKRVDGLLTDAEFQAHARYMTDHISLMREDIQRLSNQVAELQRGKGVK